MANNLIYVKRTSVSGRTPNTTGSYATNSQYIATGELALNLPDQKLFTSNGTTYFEIGSNVVNQNVTNNITVGNRSGSTITPSSINFDNTFSSVAGQNLKLNLYGGNFGLGVSSSQLDVSTSGDIAFWDAGTLMGTFSPSGLAVTGNISTTAIGTSGCTTPRSSIDTELGLITGSHNDYIQGKFALSGGGTVTWDGPGNLLS